MIREQFRLTFDSELIVDLFAGGGGMSTAIEQALGRAPDIAINHNEQALSMHMANHPQTAHYIADVYEVCPREVTNSVAVGYLHLSPDCTHHSQAAGGQPRSTKIRGLAWAGFRWAGQVKPRVISLENVKQILQWSPLVAKRDKATGRVVTLDIVTCPKSKKKINRVAEPGEHVPVQNQFLIPDPKRAGQTWKKFVKALQSKGYQVDWRVMAADHYGAPTLRERLFMVARCDEKPIVFPERTHFKNPSKRQKKQHTAAENIDFSLNCPSIFARKKPLADATLRRIAKGMKKFVLDAAEPFIVELANWSKTNGIYPTSEPLRTITAWPKGGSFALAAPTLIQMGHGEGKPGARRWSHGCNDICSPLGTITASGGGQGIATAFMMQANGGFNTTPGHDLRQPVSTITNTGSQQQLITASLLRHFGTSTGQSITDPVATIMADGGGKTALIQYELSREDESRALRCAAFLISYYGTDNMSGLDQPLPTITTRDRLALVTVWIKGEPWVIVDIGLRMLTPAELYACQGFPADYIIDHGHDGRTFTKSDQVRMCGNSVSPPPATALVSANVPELAVWSKQERKQLERIAA